MGGLTVSAGRSAGPRVSSNGPALLLLHGYAGRSQSWNEVVRMLDSACSILAPDLPGHGPVTGRACPASFEEAVDSLAAMIESTGCERCHAVGYSMGGRLVLGLLIRHPGLLCSAVVIGASPGLAGVAERHARRQEDSRWADLLRRRGLAAFLDDWEKLPLFASQANIDGARRAHQRTVRESNRAEGLAFAMEVLGLGSMPDLWPVLGAIEVPVLLVVGALDGKFRDIASRMADVLPRCRVEVVGEAGHNVVLEAPREVAAGILSHIGSVDRGDMEVS